MSEINFTYFTYLPMWIRVGKLQIGHIADPPVIRLTWTVSEIMFTYFTYLSMWSRVGKLHTGRITDPPVI